MDRRLDSAWWALRIGLGLGPFLAGLDKFFNLLANWEMYLSPLALKVVPVSAGTFMRGVGIVEMIVGLAVLTRWTRVGAYVVMIGCWRLPSTWSRRGCSSTSPCGTSRSRLAPSPWPG